MEIEERDKLVNDLLSEIEEFKNLLKHAEQIQHDSKRQFETRLHVLQATALSSQDKAQESIYRRKDQERLVNEFKEQLELL